MGKLNFIVVMAIAAGMMLLVASSGKCNNSNFTFEGSGYVSTFFVGGSEINWSWHDPNTVYGDRLDVLNAEGDYLIVMQSANEFTVDRVVVVKDNSSSNGFANFVQSYSDNPGHNLLGSFGASVSSTGLIILVSSGFSSAVMADASFSISHYVQTLNPHLTSAGVNITSLVPEGLGCSQMSAQLYENWYSPSYHIFEYWQDAWVDDSEKTGFVDVELTGDDGLDVDISSSWTTPRVKIDGYIEVYTVP